MPRHIDTHNAIYDLYKSDVKWDEKFGRKCDKYGSNWDYFQGFGKKWYSQKSCENELEMLLYILNTKNPNVRVLLDENFNTVAVVKTDEMKMSLDEPSFYRRESEKWYNSEDVTLPYPFDKITMAELMELYSRIKFREPNYTSKHKMYFNNQEILDDKNSVYCSLLSYIEFIGSNVEEYFKNSFRAKMLGFDTPNVYEYINALVASINQYFDYVTSSQWYPCAYNFISGFEDYLGVCIHPVEELESAIRDLPAVEQRVLYERFHRLTKYIPTVSFAHMLLKDRGFDLVRDDNNHCSLRRTTDEKIDLSDYAKDLTTLLTPREFVSLDEERRIKLGKTKINIAEQIEGLANVKRSGLVLRYGVVKENGELEK